MTIGSTFITEKMLFLKIVKYGYKYFYAQELTNTKTIKFKRKSRVSVCGEHVIQTRIHKGE